MSDTVNALKTAQRIVKILNDERKLLNSPDLTPRELRDHYERGWQISAEVLTGWESVGRQVLAIHPGLVESIQFAGSSKIVPEVFRTLPYINPMIVYPDPPDLFSHTKGEKMRLLGMICYGKTAFPKERIVSTHDPEAVSMCVEMIIEVTGKKLSNSNPSNWRDGWYEEEGWEATDGETGAVFECNYISFPMTGKPYTLNEVVDEVLSKFYWTKGDQEMAVRKKFMRGIIKLAIGSIMYLCSTTLEAEQVPRKTVLKSMNPIPRKPFSFYRVGWNIGAAISRSRANIDIENPSTQAKPGFEQDPQHRKAHFKTVWTGPGSMTPKTVFVAPYWTHLEKLGVAGVNTVRKVAI